MSRRREMSPLRAGTITLGVIAVASYLGTTKDIPFVNPPYEVKAAFRDSSDIRAGAPVRIAGVNVGKVKSVDPLADGEPAAVVTMAIDDKGRPLHADATAKIRPRIFLEGNFFVELTAGTPGAAELDEGDTIPTSRTSNPVQLAEVLNALQQDTRRSLQGTLHGLRETADAGGGKAFNRALPDSEVAERYTAIVAEALLGENPGDLRRFIESQGIVAGALDDDRRALRDLVTSFARTSGALADREADLRAAVAELPRTRRVALPTLTALNEAFPSVRRFAGAALPAVRSTGPAVDAALPLVRELRGLVSAEELRGLSRDLRAATPGLATVSKESVGVLEQARLLGSCTTSVLSPYGDSRVPDPNFPATGPIYEEFAKSLVGLAGESRSFDANGQWFKVLGQGGVETIPLGNGLFGTTNSPFAGVNPPPQKDNPPLEPGTPCETQEPPDLRTIPGAAPQPRRIPRTASVRRREAAARRVAITLENARLKAEGSKLRVRDRDATLKDVQAIARRLGLAGQLRRYEAKVRRAGR